jgi:hypothetical protein
LKNYLYHYMRLLPFFNLISNITRCLRILFMM